ncbi:SRPBCC domain-containing protein [Nitratireductor mangrovi]|uniref:SRPBCC domain-containing protein n=1 Tax=Nitratireductor mangrovi TaxID=2599600 RepID=A0A5B8L1P9_9HYPH|nr:SRPBCC domain-containing protein [Nitratireductor mangrovi]
MTQGGPEARDEDEVVVEDILASPPQTVWRALTVPELAADWLGATPDDASADHRDGSEPGFAIEESAPDEGRVVYRWRDGAGAAASVSRVTVEIAPAGDGATWFRLTHEAPARAPRAANMNGPPLASAA